MNYISTRDKQVRRTASEAILQGISAEGGLFIPEEFPRVDLDFIGGLCGLPYHERARRIMALYLDDFSAEDLQACTEGAYLGTFEEDCPAPVRRVGEMNLLELWHGPTCAFKDMALQMLPRLVSAARRNLGDDREAVVLVATSGDTGKAALEGFRDVEGTGIVVFYPVDGVSQIQRLQMATQQGENVAVQAVEGNFDDCQTGVKRIFADGRFADRLAGQGRYLTSANSINWGRLLPQIVYYFSAYADLVSAGELRLGEKLNVSVPTGNFGNILACYYAGRMGLPVGKLICASNRNDVLTQFLTTGSYDRRREFHLTNTPSMDILISSNLERFLFHLFGENDRAVSYCMYRLNEGGEYSVTAEALDRIREEFAAYSCDDAETLETIRRLHYSTGYVMDPHTAVAVNAYEQYRAETGDEGKVLIVSTASPFKFADSVLTALREEVPDSEFDCLTKLAACSSLAVPASLAELSHLPVRFQGAVRPQEMERAVARALEQR
ncbi:MAG: threonine synthase [Clostridiales bacterium]|nr:threonine synthase [Clostridiales bacterium]